MKRYISGKGSLPKAKAKLGLNISGYFIFINWIYNQADSGIVTENQ